MNTTLHAVVIAVYVLLLTVVALRARAATVFADFSVARRALPLALVFGSLAATYVGPVFSIGFVGKGFTSGFLFWGIGLAYAAQNILVGLFIAPRLRALGNCHTLGDAVGQKYDRTCQILAGVISVGVCAGLAAVMAKAGGDVLRNIFLLPHWSAVVIVVGITTLYTTFGGLKASVVTDAFQFTSFAVLLPAALIWILLSHPNPGGITFTKAIATTTMAGFKSTSPMQIVGLLTAFLLGETLIPPYANRALASKTTAVSRNSFILAGLFSIAWFAVMIALGIAGRTVILGDPPEDNVLMILIESTIPRFGYTLLLVVLISVIMSSLDSLLNAGAVVFTQDIVKPFAKLSDNAALNLGRCATIAIAATACAGAVAVKSIVSGLLVCYTIWAPAILPALIIGLWVKRPHPLAGILSMGVGTIVAIVFEFVYHSAIGIPTIIPALGAGLLAYALGHWMEKTKFGA
ncbi:MAG: sodium:solute symporter family protein [Sedimentisphaerales bacterium]|nr:sodium:solute symporter family protein [Sedimentisphaerales bacterium]